LRGLVLLPVVFVAFAASAGGKSPVKSDEEVVLFTTCACRAGGDWIVPIHGWIFEPEPDSSWRELLTSTLADALDKDAPGLDQRIFEKRLRWFLVDNERGKQVPVRIAGEVHRTSASGADGHFSTGVRVPAGRLPAEPGTMVETTLVTRPGDRRRFAGRVQLVPPEGITVVSDIDDTIKITGVLDRTTMIHNTFYRSFQAVPGMARVYRQWAAQGAVFFYLSASPWQLFPALDAFLQETGFPPGAMRLRNFRVKDRSLVRFLRSSEDYKTSTIRALMKKYPQRRFVLVGDAGERDPEVYGHIARVHPERVLHVFIRKVDGADLSQQRFARAFAGTDPHRWTLFDDPAELGRHVFSQDKEKSP